MPICGPTHTTCRSLSVLALAGCALLIAPALTGCSGSGQSRDTDSSAVAIDPVEAYNQRSREQAIELFRHASHLHENGEFDKALTKYRESIEKDNTLFAAWNNMGQLFMQKNNYADAVASYKVASDLQKTDPRPDYNIGLAYQTIGWGDESYTHFGLSLDRDPNYLPSIRGVVRSAEMLGIGDQKVLEFIRNGQLRETDDQWREYFDRQRFRVEKMIDQST